MCIISGSETLVSGIGTRIGVIETPISGSEIHMSDEISTIGTLLVVDKVVILIIYVSLSEILF